MKRGVWMERRPDDGDKDGDGVESEDRGIEEVDGSGNGDGKMDL